MSISRSWTTIEAEKTQHDAGCLEDCEVSECEYCTTPISDSDRAYLDGLMEEWSSIKSAIEDEGFRRQAQYEDGDGPDFDTDEEYEEYKQSERDRSMRRQAKLDIIESLLHSHGARVMRPYEHWNEDEAYMQYQECGRFGHDC
jgi:hypothetical protein